MFEAEQAVLSDPAGTADSATMTVETGTEWAGMDDTGMPLTDGAEVTNVGYFATSGQTITWTITASADCDATLTLRAASALMDWTGMDWTTFTGLAMVEMDLSQNQYVTLSVNGEQQSLSGTLPGLTGLGFGAMSHCYKNFGTGTASIHLNKGENTVVLTATGASGAGVNVDKITINSTAELTFSPADNSSRPSSHQQAA